ncbi:MAG TPA: DUF975 family protein [Tissierellaceae bacterium]
MWTRREIKENAKSFLRKYYFKAFIVSLILILVTSSNTGSNPPQDTNNYNYESGIEQIPGVLRDFDEEVNDNFVFKGMLRNIITLPFTIFAVGLSLFSAVLISVIISVIRYLIEVGSARFFLKGYKEEPEIVDVFSTFNSREWLNISVTQFIVSILVFLWSLLLVIPGIIKSIEYSFVPYILAEEPNISTKEALRISKQMTYGNKWDIFVLRLSFLGWDFLGAMLFGIGGIFVRPYKEATYASLYYKLSDRDPLEGIYY